MTTSNTPTLTITRPDDWHLHLRDNDALVRTVYDTARYFGRAIIMPNLRPPVTTTEMAQAYYQRILGAKPQGSVFEPLMTLYLTDNTSADEIIRAKESGIVQGVKLYPAGATTNSDAGVTNLQHCRDALEAMQKVGMPLLVHGEVTDSDIDVFDREKVFIERILSPLLRQFPELKVVFEHITTENAVQFVNASHDKVAATITPHHLLLNRNDMLVGGIRPHHYCLPVLKRNTHQQALIRAATSGHRKFFLGTDSAPHAQHTKETSCGCAGIYSAHAAIELYAEVFESVGALDKLEAFASFNGADFYGLPRNQDSITLTKQSWQVPESYPFAESALVPMRAGEHIHWKVIAD
ncbi:dihydroorotase [Methylophaga lonarensis MPL]|uniref:Dihydroorotase n=1 Tax=Methylophaga lonarensis MPL TaxID=1286106 RepID=M7NXA5_9GAMM|nr:dihydroorotase [Methylophaga lonarensis]EMR13418.1 dihydroorotase [Methylophaga lonarensis MPL]